MEHSFNIEHAKKYGDREAIMIKNFVFWITLNKANKSNNHDGRTWTYNSVDALEKIFSYWSTSKVRTVLKSLIKQEILITGNYNKNSYDRTKWYAFKDEKAFLQKSLFDLSKLTNEVDKNNKSYKDTNTDTNNNIKEKDKKERLVITPQKEIINPKLAKVSEDIVSFEKFWNVYAYKVNKKASLKAWKKLTEEKRNKAIKGAKVYNKYLVDNNKTNFKMHPATYLNGERWNDELNIKQAAIKTIKPQTNEPDFITNYYKNK